eukprot:CAMPEP_0116828650 /NCGR_PEP_ID=MMETSP0418-20121206/3766_1 /TAXON_ID=1158023 /ORGANISM="Astrosyne radiata, Strain 13vi08-1A" /LENGTH=179 /DNA_ID=CAMNT_0004457547 /DNA_START=9 /DNA_END=548 /DNA_ORIENTATION=-
MASVHFLDLHESPDTGDGDYKRLRMSCFLLNDGLPKNAPSEFELQEGDLLAVDELFTGAGDLEGIRFVGPENDGRYLLLDAGVEELEWPLETLEFWAKKKKNNHLRELYEGPLNVILDQVASATLEDIGGGVDELFDSAEGSPFRADEEGEWEIPLSKCVWKPCLRPEEEEHQKQLPAK